MFLNSLTLSAPLAAVLFLLLTVIPCSATAGDYVKWEMKNLAVEEPLTAVKGDAKRGRRLVIATDKGNCLACHKMPVPEEIFHGTLGPDLHGVASRFSEAQLRLRLVDEKQLNPRTIMPGFYRHPDKLRLVADEYQGQTLLSAQEIEDVLAYLMTLK